MHNDAPTNRSATSMPIDAEPESGGSDDPAVSNAQVVSLYERGMSVRRIAAQTGIGRRQVRSALADADVPVAPRGRGRPRPTQQTPVPRNVAKLLPVLYVEHGWTRSEVATFFGVAEHRVRAWMRHAGITSRTRGSANREDRRRLELGLAEELYIVLGYTADEVASATGHTRRDVLASLHEAGLPVRVPNSATGEDHVILDELYDDPLVADTLNKHAIPAVRTPGPLHLRFPTRVDLTDSALRELYQDCGLAVIHIELLTGQPSATVRKLLKRADIPARPAGGLSPFRRRHRRPPRRRHPATTARPTRH